MRQPTALTFVLLLAGGPCLADDGDCSAKAFGNATQLTLNTCAQRDAEVSDKGLRAADPASGATVSDMSHRIADARSPCRAFLRDQPCAVCGRDVFQASRLSRYAV